MMRNLLQAIDGLNDWVGRTVSWLVLLMAALTFVIVILRYCFNVGWVWLQEVVLYLHAIVFLTASGWVLKRDGHVRVDVWYRSASPRAQAWVNLAGSALLLLPTCFLIFYQAWPYVMDSWEVLEGSADGGGLDAVFVIKTFILIFSALLALQGVSMMGHGYLKLREPR